VTPARRPRITVVSPLATWLPDTRAVGAFRRRVGTMPMVRAARDDAWHTIAPGFGRAAALVRDGVPFHVVADHDHDRAPDPATIDAALASGATVLFPGAHEVLPRVARLMVALRAEIFGPLREESSYLFLVDGKSREGMGLHHDGEVDNVWLQLEGERTVTYGPPVARDVPEEIDVARIRTTGRGWRTHALAPGSLFSMPARTPHHVVCHDRSLALTLTWRRAARRRAGADAIVDALTEWPVASGRAEPWPPGRDSRRPRDPIRLWTQVPAVPARLTRRDRGVTVITPLGRVVLPPHGRAIAARLAAMPALEVDGKAPSWLATLLEAGILADEDLPQVIVPSHPARLDGWQFR
jgi:hypothetical protein